MTTDLATAAGTLRQLHHATEPLILPNAWDAASAKLVEAAGFPAVATTSGGVAQALGFEDHEQAPPDEMLAAVRRIAAAVSVPVTADIEAGYGLAADELIDRLLKAGAVGLNLEDTDHRADALVDPDRQAERIAAVRAAADAAGVPVVINARVDVFIRQAGGLDEMLDRGRRYAEAGADCVYPIGVADEDTIAALVDGMGAPINVMARKGAPSLARLAELGVRRVSFAGGLARSTMRATAAMLDAIRSGNEEAAF